MSIESREPNTIWLGGPGTEVNDVAAGEALTPGMLIERYDDSGTPKFRKATTAKAASTVALNQSMLNRGIDDAYADEDLVEAVILGAGGTWYGIIPSGQNLAAGDLVETNGTGKVIALASGIAIARVVEAVNNAIGPGDARIKLEAI